MTRPPGPVPFTFSRRTPREAAILRARGEDFTRTPGVAGTPEARAAAAARARGVRGRPEETAGRDEGASAGAAAGAVALGLSSSFSPSPRITASGAPTMTLPPSSTKISARVPSSKDSISMVALSVSTSARMSPTAILSPFFLHHRTRVPSVMVSLSLGIVISGMVVRGKW